MTDTEFYSFPARQLYLLEHHFNYIHKPPLRQAFFRFFYTNLYLTEAFKICHLWIILRFLSFPHLSALRKSYPHFHFCKLSTFCG